MRGAAYYLLFCFVQETETLTAQCDAGKHCEQRTSVPCTDRRAPSGRTCPGHQGAALCSGPAVETRESLSVGGPTDVHLLSPPINSLASCSQRKRGVEARRGGEGAAK